MAFGEIMLLIVLLLIPGIHLCTGVYIWCEKDLAHALAYLDITGGTAHMYGIEEYEW